MQQSDFSQLCGYIYRKILHAKWWVLYFNDIELYGSDFTYYCQRALLFTAPVALPGTLSVLSHFTEPMHVLLSFQRKVWVWFSFALKELT